MFRLTPQAAGLAGSFFAFTNFFARPLGGFVSYRPLSRRASMVYTLAGITAGFILMGLAGSSSLAAAVRRLLIRRPRRARGRDDRERLNSSVAATSAARDVRRGEDRRRR